jgi:hypothetical protein
MQAALTQESALRQCKTHSRNIFFNPFPSFQMDEVCHKLLVEGGDVCGRFFCCPKETETKRLSTLTSECQLADEFISAHGVKVHDLREDLLANVGREKSCSL